MTDEKFIFRTKVEKEYTVIRNSLIVDRSLSWEARALVIYLLSKPETWIVMKRDLIEASPAADKKTTKILKELETAGYIKRKKFRNEKGQWEWHTWVYDTPQPPPIPPKRGSGETIPPKTAHGETTPGNGGHIVNTESERTELENKEIIKEEDIGKVFSSFEDNISPMTPMQADFIKDELKEGTTPELIIDAIKEAVKYDARNWKYISAIINDWKKNGRNNRRRKDARKNKENFGEVEITEADKRAAEILREKGLV